jgi:RND family efflux transporter MFP subunit
MRWLLALVVLLLLVVGAVKLHFMRIHQNDAIPDARMPPWAVRTSPVEQRDLATSFPVLATVLTSEEITLACQIQGEILEMGPREGQTVKKGELLARIDTREIDQQILAEEAKLEAAKADLVNKTDQFKRLKAVLDKGGTSQSEYDAAQTAVLAAEHTVESLKRLIEALKIRKGYGEIRSPANGIVAARLAEPGNICAPSEPLYRITVTGGARVRVALPQNIIDKLQPDSTLVLTNGKDLINVTLSRIFPALDARALGFAEASVDKPPFGAKSGGRVPGRVILSQRKQALVVPHKALLVSSSDPAKGTVFKVRQAEDDSDSSGAFPTIQAVPVQIDLDSEDGVAVLGELKPGTPVVVAHQIVLLKLHDGDPVNVVTPR